MSSPFQPSRSPARSPFHSSGPIEAPVIPVLGPTSALSTEDVRNGLAEIRSAAGGFSSQLTWRDRLRLRAITKQVHMKNYPKHLLTDLEADRIIDVMAPETWTFLIHKHGDMR
jgi:hypothetical protein